MLRLMNLLVSVSLLMVACNSGDTTNEGTNRKDGFSQTSKTKEDSLYHDVMAGHDVGMAKIGKLRGAMAETRRRLDSIDKQPAIKLNTYQRKLSDLETSLTNADAAMNVWMKDFKVDTLADNKELRIQYLEAEKEKVVQVQRLIFAALLQADSVLYKKGN